MADKPSFIQIPSTVWWGVRGLLQRSPSMTINEATLGVEFQVQDSAAKAYIAQLKSAGIITEENKATSLATDWRLDDKYSDSVDKLIKKNYPQELIDIAPPENQDRGRAVQWFLRQGLGEGAAGNKAATYLLVGSPQPGGAAQPKAATPKNPTKKVAPASKQVTPEKPSRSIKQRSNESPKDIPLNINVQIHISAESSTEQIEAIFASMRKYLYDE